MADYISRETALDLAYWHGEKATVDNPDPYGVGAVDVSDIKSIPAADVVEVVRCKDCAWCSFDSIGNQCCFYGVKLLDSELRPDFYCSHGQKREAGEIEDDP